MSMVVRRQIQHTMANVYRRIFIKIWSGFSQPLKIVDPFAQGVPNSLLFFTHSELVFQLFRVRENEVFNANSMR